MIDKKGALLIGSLAILFNIILALGGILVTEFVIGEFTLQGVLSLEQARTAAMCSNLLFNIVGTDYSVRSDLPDSRSANQLIQFYNIDTLEREFGFSQDALRAFESEDLYIGICSGTESEVVPCLRDLGIRQVIMQCNSTIYHPKTIGGSGVYDVIFVQIGQDKITFCENQKSGECKPQCGNFEYQLGKNANYCDDASLSCCLFLGGGDARACNSAGGMCRPSCDEGVSVLEPSCGTGFQCCAS
ncbi:hypothetical protein COT72_03295 [archaeon CG10_big_fil_rev_8_21_14_0_10_43_11]|nr:MAG: hypothetical protein COT72_03295 [archaeon CG10_big_fil_rev_8_21_14_0_10_43_11]